MAQQPEQYYRQCPGERVRISDAVCSGRRRANFAKCKTCQFNTDRRGQDDIQQAVERRADADQQRGLSDDRLIRVFGPNEILATYPDPFNEEIAWRIGYATSQFLRSQLSGVDRADRKANTMVVAHDLRPSSPALTEAFIDGALSTGADVFDIGPTDLAQICFAVNHLAACGGAHLGAGPSPATCNGLQVAGAKGKAIGPDSGLEEIRRLAVSVPKHESSQRGQRHRIDLAQPYKTFIRQRLKPLRPMKVVVDASNGVAGKWLPLLFDDVPALRLTKINFDPPARTGRFAHEPDPFVEANLRQLQLTVRQNRADFGVCFDANASRCSFVDETGTPVRSDLLAALLAAHLLRESPGAAVVYDLRSSRVLKEEIERAGGLPRRQRPSHVFMKRAMLDSDAVFGATLSGQFYFRDNGGSDSSLLALVAVLNLLADGSQSLGKRLAPLQRYVSTGPRCFRSSERDAALARLQRKYADARPETLEGLTVQYPDWWFHVDKGDDDALLRLHIEATTQELLDRKLAELTPLLGEPQP